MLHLSIHGLFVATLGSAQVTCIPTPTQAYLNLTATLVRTSLAMQGICSSLWEPSANSGEGVAGRLHAPASEALNMSARNPTHQSHRLAGHAIPGQQRRARIGAAAPARAQQLQRLIHGALHARAP